MNEVEIHDGTIDIDASIVARGLELEPSSIHAMMRKGEITSLCERGVDEDAGFYRLTFFHKSRRLRLIVDGTGTVMRRSIINFGTRPLPVSMHALDTQQFDVRRSDADAKSAGRCQQPATDARELQSGTDSHPDATRKPAA